MPALLIDIVRTVLTAYFAWTLSATGLAKIVNRHEAAVGMLREAVVPRRYVTPTVVGVGLVEVSLAGSLPFASRVVSIYVIALLFGGFGVYHLMVARRTRAILCTCAGVPGPRDPVTRAALTGRAEHVGWLHWLRVRWQSRETGFPFSEVP